jgi:hypothetical protein
MKENIRDGNVYKKVGLPPSVIFTYKRKLNDESQKELLTMFSQNRRLRLSMPSFNE